MSHRFERSHPRSEEEGRLPTIKHLLEATINHSSINQPSTATLMTRQPSSLPDLLNDSEEDDEDTLSTPSVTFSPKQTFHRSPNAAAAANNRFTAVDKNNNRSQQHAVTSIYHRRKSIPYRSPSVVQDAFHTSVLDKSVVFQLDVHNNNNTELSTTTPATVILPLATGTSPTTAHTANHSRFSSSFLSFCSDCGDTCDLTCTSKVISGQSLLSALRKRVAHARTLQKQHVAAAATAITSNHHRHKRARTASIIEIPKSIHHHQQQKTSHIRGTSLGSDNSSRHRGMMINERFTTSSTNQFMFSESTAVMYDSSCNESSSTHTPSLSTQSPYATCTDISIKEEENNDDGAYGQEDGNDENHKNEVSKKIDDVSFTAPATTTTAITATATPTVSSGRPARVKGPCQACQESTDGCMRKAFNWPFPSTQTFYDKGRPFVYLCNKCGLRYNKSGGCVCRNCRWVFCKEEKRKALQHIEIMRHRRDGQYVDTNEDIEGFVCSPKYWICGKPWKVGWLVLNDLDQQQHEDEEDFLSDEDHSL